MTNFSNLAGAGFDNSTPALAELTDPIRNLSDQGSDTYNQTAPDSGDTIDALEDDDKTLGGQPLDAVAGMDIAIGEPPSTNRLEDVFTNRLQFSIPNHRSLSVADLGSLFMLGFTVVDASNSLAQSIPHRITLTLRDHPDPQVGGIDYPQWHRYAYLDVSPDAVVVDLDAATSGTQGVPHAALLFDWLTPLNPGDDGRDNDDDGVPDDTPIASSPVSDRGERTMPGLLNINTVPPFLATLATPLPEHLDDAEGLFRAIAAYRDYPAVRTTANGYPSGMPTNATPTAVAYRPGIGSIGELLFVNDRTSNAGGFRASANLTDNGVMQAVGRDGAAMNYDRLTDTTSGNEQPYDRYDLQPLPEVQQFYDDSAATTDDIIRREAVDGPDERLARFQFLSNLFTTRSDVYTAYVVIRGYTAGAYQNGPVEQAHYIAVFDRSGLRDAQTPVRLVAFERVF
jgi:hypothetical protein